MLRTFNLDRWFAQKGHNWWQIIGVRLWHWNQSSQWKQPEEPRPKKYFKFGHTWTLSSLFTSIAMMWCIMNSSYKILRSTSYTTLKLCTDRAKQFVRKAYNCGKTNHAHTSMLVLEFLGRNKTVIMPQPPYSPDLAPDLIFSSSRNWRHRWKEIVSLQLRR